MGLRRWGPLFARGAQARSKLVDGGLSPAERQRAETESLAGEVVLDWVVHEYGGLLSEQTRAMIRTSMLPARDDVFDVVFYAGVGGLGRGLCKFDPAKVGTSSTNYLAGWFLSYASKQVSMMEAPMGVAPTRYRQLKKIAAVRARMHAATGRWPTTGEVVEEFHSGRADRTSQVGRKTTVGGTGFKTNLAVTAQMVEEQAEVWDKAMTVRPVDTGPGSHLPGRVMFSDLPADVRPPWGESLFGLFCALWTVTVEAAAVMRDRCGYTAVSGVTLPAARRRGVLSAAWDAVVSDPHGPFREFAGSLSVGDVSGVDVRALPGLIDSGGEDIGAGRWDVLFEDGRASRR